MRSPGGTLSPTQPNVEGYAEFLQYVGKQEEEYFLMLDANNKRKYILPLPQGDFTRTPCHI
jgi:hypothetical protein